MALQKEKENHKFTFISEEINAWNTFWNINKPTLFCSEKPYSKDLLLHRNQSNDLLINLLLICFMLEAKLWDDPLVNTTSNATAFLLRFSDILLNLQSDVLRHGKSAPL